MLPCMHISFLPSTAGRQAFFVHHRERLDQTYILSDHHLINNLYISPHIFFPRLKKRVVWKYSSTKMCLDQKSQIYLYVIRAEGNEQENLGVASSIFFSRFCTHPLHVFHIALLPQRHQCQSGHKSGLLPLPPPRCVINQVYMQHGPVFRICPLKCVIFWVDTIQTKIWISLLPPCVVTSFWIWRRPYVQ